MHRRLVIRIWLAALLAAWAWGVAQPSDAVELLVEHDMAVTFEQGSEHELWIRIWLVDPLETVDVAVLFLNVVEHDEARRYPQAMHRVFESATELGDVEGRQEAVERFLVPIDGDTLRAGVEARVRVRLRDRAPLGTYSMVFQVYEGDETNPHRVRIDDRLDMWPHAFEVVPASP